MKRILPCLISLLVTGAISSQELQITYDFNTGKSTYSRKIDKTCFQKEKTVTKKPAYLQKGEEIKVTVKNLNQLVYNVDFNKTSTTYNMTPPKFPELGGIPLVSLSAAAKATGKPPTNPKEATLYYMNLVRENTAAYYKLVSGLHDWKIDDAKITKLKSSAKTVAADLKSNLDLLSESYGQYLNTTDANAVQQKEIIRMKTAIDGINFDQMLADLELLTNALESNTLFEFTIPAQTASGDQTTIKMNFSPKEGKAALPISSASKSFSFKVNRKLRHSFSTGIFYSSVTNQKFTSQPNFAENSALGIDTVTNYTVRKESGKEQTFGLGGFYHFTYHPHINYGIGLHLGGGVDLEEKVQYMAGITLAFGQKNRILLNGGLAFAQVDVLADAYTEGLTTASALDLGTHKKLENGVYFSLSYNLFE